MLLRPYPAGRRPGPPVRRRPAPTAAAPATPTCRGPTGSICERNSTLVEAFIAEKITGTTLNVGDRAERASRQHGVGELLRRASACVRCSGADSSQAKTSAATRIRSTVISYQMWQERFHGDPDDHRQDADAQRRCRTRSSASRRRDSIGTFVGYAFQFWVPASMQPQFDAGVYKLEDRGARWIEGFVRLKPGVTIEQAQAELSAIADAARARVSGDQSRTRHPAVSAVADAVQQRRRAAADARHRARRRPLRAADRVRQRRQSAAGPRVRAAAGDDDSVVDRRRPRRAWSGSC